MNPILKNFIAVVIGLIVGGAINMGVILISDSIIPPPPGADVTTTEGLIASMHLFEPKHFIMPFLAHAIGTLVGALITALMAANNNMKLAMLIGLFNLVGGIMAIMTLPAPIWFSALDAIGAYIPMAYLGGWIATKKIRS